MHTLNQQEGMALITVMLLGVLGAAIIISIYYLSKNLIFMSGINSRYLAKLEDAKGVANYIVSTIMSSNRELECGVNGSSICIPNETIDCNSSSRSYLYIPEDIYDSTRHEVKACYLFSVHDPNAVVPYTMYGFWIEVSSSTGDERVEIDFVYKVK